MREAASLESRWARFRYMRHGFRHTFFWAWLILLGVFVTDATLTLFRRLLRGEKVYVAHRSHAYQHAALKFGAHRPVTLAVAIVNAFWLLPIAVLVAANKVNATLGLLAAYLPLVWTALKLHAGGSLAQRRDCPPPS